MALTRDPHNREYTHLHHAVNLNDKRIIEIGCGDGRLTALYQEMAQSVVGVDLAEQALQTAHQNLHDKANFALVDATQLPFRKDKFDVAIFAWSL